MSISILDLSSSDDTNNTNDTDNAYDTDDSDDTNNSTNTDDTNNTDNDNIITIIPPFQNHLLMKLDLPTDILKYIGKFLFVDITCYKIHNTYANLFMVNEQHNMINNLTYINKYAKQYAYSFEEFHARDNWYYYESFGHIIIKFLYGFSNSPQNNQILIEFMQNICINCDNAYLLIVDHIDPSLCNKIIWYPLSILEILFFVVFTPSFLQEILDDEFANLHKYMLRDLNNEFNNNFNTKRIEQFKQFKQYTKADCFNTDHFLEFLKNVILDRQYKIVLDYYDDRYSGKRYTLIIKCDDNISDTCTQLKYVCPFFEILLALRFWNDDKLYIYIQNMIDKIDESKNNIVDINADNYVNINHLRDFRKKFVDALRIIISDNGFLLLDVLTGSENFIHNLGDMLASAFASQNIMTLKKYYTNTKNCKNISKFMTSSVFLFELVKRRQFRTIKYLFNVCNKKAMIASYINNKNQNLLEFACESRGLNQNIISMFLESGLFESKHLNIRNRKVKKLKKVTY